MSKYMQYFKELAINNMSQKTSIKNVTRLTLSNNTVITFDYKSYHVTGSLGNEVWYFASSNPKWNVDTVKGVICTAVTNYESGNITLKFPRSLIHIFNNLEVPRKSYCDLFNAILAGFCAEAYVPYKRENIKYNENGTMVTYAINEREAALQTISIEIRGSYLCMILKSDVTPETDPGTFKVYDILARQYVDYTEFI